MGKAKSREQRIAELMHDGEKLYYASELKKTGLLIPLCIAVLGGLVALYPFPIIDMFQNIDPDLGALAITLLDSPSGKFLGIIFVVMSMASAAQGDTKQRNTLCFITNQRVVRVKGNFSPELREFYLNRIGFVELKRTTWERFTSRGRLNIFDNAWSFESKKNSERHCIRMESIYYPARFRQKLKEAIERYKDVSVEREKENPSMEKFTLSADYEHHSQRRGKKTQHRHGQQKRRRKR